MPEHLPEMVMAPKAAAQMLTRNRVDYVPIAEAEGRVATTLMLVYPPGIGTVLPGERLDERAKPMLDYFKMFEAAANLFPGFEAEIQGVYRESDPDGRIRFHTYVLREGA
jgi:ornithine decarboxylase